MGITITDSEKVGFIRIDFNNLYPNISKHKTQTERKENVVVDIIQYAGEECVELMSNINENLLLTTDQFSDNFLYVASVNGVAPYDLNHLRTLILNLL